MGLLNNFWIHAMSHNNISYNNISYNNISYNNNSNNIEIKTKLM